jgi:apolipoprotein D and lipocalin family protein
MQALVPMAAQARLDDAAHRSADDDEDLDTRIRRAEQQLVERDERVLGHVKSLGHRVRRMADPQRWAAPVAGGAAVLLTAWWLWRRQAHAPRRAPAVQTPDHSMDGARAVRGAGAALGIVGAGRLLMQMLPVVWPLIPVRWRPNFNPASATSMLAFGLALARRRMRLPAQGAVRTAPHVDLRRYAGTWHEIARLPEPHEQACHDQPRATYTPRGQEIEVLNRCHGADGIERRAHGVAQVVPGSGGAKLKVSFAPAWLHWLPLVWADYWVLYVDPDYSVALVGNPQRDRLWLLARQRSLAPAALRAVLDIARVQGFPVDQLQPSQPH